VGFGRSWRRGGFGLGRALCGPLLADGLALDRSGCASGLPPVAGRFSAGSLTAPACGAPIRGGLAARFGVLEALLRLEALIRRPFKGFGMSDARAVFGCLARALGRRDARPLARLRVLVPAQSHETRAQRDRDEKRDEVRARHPHVRVDRRDYRCLSARGLTHVDDYVVGVYRVFPKLGITARSELSSALGAGGEGGFPPAEQP
jgi:hypothetical protein